MDDLAIIDMAANESNPNLSLMDKNIILITGITEANINSAIRAAESSTSSENVTVGIIAGNINPLNKNMKRLSELADAVIISRENFADSSRIITEAISDIITKFGFVNLEIEDVKEIFRDAGTVYFGTGTAKSAGVAALKASEMCGDITSAKRFLVSIISGAEIPLGNMTEAAHVIAGNADPDAQIIWGHVIDDNMSGNVRVTIFAAMNDKGRL